MNYPDFFKALKAVLPVAYGRWGRGHAPDLPYAIVIDTGDEPFYADDHALIKNKNLRVEYYFELKDPSAEAKLESFFDAQEVPWICDGDTYIETENFYERIYYLEIGD